MTATTRCARSLIILFGSLGLLLGSAATAAAAPAGPDRRAYLACVSAGTDRIRQEMLALPRGQRAAYLQANVRHEKQICRARHLEGPAATPNTVDATVSGTYDTPGTYELYSACPDGYREIGSPTDTSTEPVEFVGYTSVGGNDVRYTFRVVEVPVTVTLNRGCTR